jgi:hypothetical protein
MEMFITQPFTTVTEVDLVQVRATTAEASREPTSSSTLYYFKALGAVLALLLLLHPPAARWGAAVSRLCNDLAGLIVIPREWGSVVASLGHP